MINEVMVYFGTIVDNFLSETCKTTWYVLKITETCCNDVQNNSENYFSKNCQPSSVPMGLLSLTSMLIDGVNIDNQIFTQQALTFCSANLV